MHRLLRESSTNHRKINFLNGRASACICMISFLFINFLNGIIFSLHPIAIISSGGSIPARTGAGDAEHIPFNGAGCKKLIFLMQHHLRNGVSAEIAK